jgi:hypothetical protein
MPNTTEYNKKYYARPEVKAYRRDKFRRQYHDPEDEPFKAKLLERHKRWYEKNKDEYNKMRREKRRIEREERERLKQLG